MQERDTLSNPNPQRRGPSHCPPEQLDPNGLFSPSLAGVRGLRYVPLLSPSAIPGQPFK